MGTKKGKEEVTKFQKISWDIGCIHYLDCGGGFMGIFIHKKDHIL